MAISYDDEITVSESTTMDELKYKVKSWLASSNGRDYEMEVVSERHIILTKAKHDMKVCCYGCICMILSIFLTIPFFMFTIPYNEQAFLGAMMVYVGLIGAIMVITTAIFCLKPEKAVFEMRFGSDIPIRIHIHRTGEMQKSAYEYESLKSTITGGADPLGGPSPIS